ncbi:hypothetical protein I302_100810 [Kwoniella bestiolae CBS 10118]|uniref:Oxidoreductase n=1 Tax=Kwoniella bestiolae CBS 10118 TaxID=1296100 RepID=A0A1B9G633_9TREE|nr:hypothetical protein I302_04183 [Kwoniella bestiolae CBS 10118]OCF26497.1 hypothetical protein I302_04183 [Kwoniella bestiolae CBS 10118]
MSSPIIKPRSTTGPLRTSILGTGMSLSVFHEPTISLLPQQFILHSIYERSAKGRLDPLLKAGKLRDVKVVRTLEEVLEDSEVELVVISTPNNTHFDYAKRSLESGKHVLIEKPICPTLKEAEELYRIAEERGLAIGVYQNRRWDSDFLTLRKLLNDGKLGPITELTSSFDRYRPLPSTYTPGVNWKETPGESNESIYNLGSHLIDQAVVLFGKPQKVMGRVWDSRGIGLDENFEVTLFYPSQTITLKASILSPLPHQLRYLVKGTKGTYVKYTLPPSHPSLKKFNRGVDHEGFDSEPEEGWGTVWAAKEERDGTDFMEEKVPALSGNYTALYENLFESINIGDRGKLSVKKEQVLSVLRIIELARKSSEQGKVLVFE